MVRWRDGGGGQRHSGIQESDMVRERTINYDWMITLNGGCDFTDGKKLCYSRNSVVILLRHFEGRDSS